MRSSTNPVMKDYVIDLNEVLAHLGSIYMIWNSVMLRLDEGISNEGI